MLRDILALPEAWICKRAIVAELLPLVDWSRRRKPDMDDRIWLDPYTIGFLTMLISLIANRKLRPLDPEALGHVQSEAWATISGLDSALIGPEVVQLSMSDNPQFRLGCQNAVMFEQELCRVAADGTGLSVDDVLADHPLGANDTLKALWRNYFDRDVLSADEPVDPPFVVQEQFGAGGVCVQNIDANSRASANAKER